MRRYKLVLTGPKNTSATASATGATSSTATASSSKPITATYDSQINGQDNPSALDIAFDVATGPLALAFASSYVELFGISLQDVAKASQWQGGILSLYGGFSSGYPLANASQYGLLATGTVLQAFGNWTGTHQSILFFLTPAGTDKQIIFHWQKGQKLSVAVTAALATSYVGYTLKSKLTTDPTAANEDIHLCPSIYALRDYLKTKTNELGIAPQLDGVDLAIDTTGINIGLYDTPNSNTPTKLAFNDFQGQPVYFGVGGNSGTVQTTLNLRSDLAYGGRWTFPSQVAAGFSLTQPASQAPLPQDKSALTGTFTTIELRHVGRFRSPQGADWITIANGNPLT
jgi:hypothetical protein